MHVHLLPSRGLKVGLHQISPFMINASQVMMSIIITKLCSLRIVPLLLNDPTEYLLLRHDNRVICLHQLRYFFKLLCISFATSVGIAKGTRPKIPRLTEGVDAPSAYSFRNMDNIVSQLYLSCSHLQCRNRRSARTK